jgi:diaminopimelate epimerase
MLIHKGVALGNDYLVIDEADLPWPLTPARCRAICDRHAGVGSDGILVIDLSHGFSLRILNPDGSEAEKSGNGLRILAAWLYDRGLVRRDWFTVRLVRDSVRMRVEAERDDGALDVRAEMGIASFNGADVGFDGAREVIGHTLALPGGGTADVTTVSMANPHCVVFVNRLDRTDFLHRAPQLCTHRAFAYGTNVQFASVFEPDALEIWIWERGVGETLASGSSACAAAAAAVRRGLLQPGPIEVRMRGGTADIEVGDKYSVRLRGPARMVFRARIPRRQVQAWGRLQAPTS